jgi:hypothetical protein
MGNPEQRRPSKKEPPTFRARTRSIKQWGGYETNLIRKNPDGSREIVRTSVNHSDPRQKPIFESDYYA